MTLKLKPHSLLKENIPMLVGIAVVWLSFVGMEIAKGFYFNSGNVDLLHYTIFGLYLYLPWFLFSMGIGFLANHSLNLAFLSKRSFLIHGPIALLWACCHVLILSSAYWVFWPERVAQVSVGFVLGEQAVKWLHLEVLAYFMLLGLWRRQLSKPEELSASRSSADSNGELSLVTDSGIVKLRAEDIHWLLADDNYVIVHADKRKIRVRGTMKEMLKQLRAEQFQQTHRSAIVNMAKVQEIGNQRLTLESGSRVPVSRRRHRHLIAAFNK